MSENLITAGFVDPREFPLEEIRQQVAIFLDIPLQQIERIECWKHQIWVKIVESRAKFVSYRCLPIWLEQGIIVIENCTSRPMLDKLGQALRAERDWYDQNDLSEVVQVWRDFWAKQAQYLREEEERLKPIREHQQAGVNWYNAWQGVLGCCRDCSALERLAPEINQQGQEFVDLPDVMQAMQQFWHQRWHELSEAIA
jgi:hypothetical protein